MKSETGSAAIDKRIDFDIAVVGGGLVGASLALMAAAALPNCRIGLIEAKPIQQGESAASGFNHFDGRSTALAPSSVGIFKQLHLWELLSEHACSINRVHVSDRGNLGLMEITRDDNDGNSLGEVLENRGMGGVLLRALQQHPQIQLFSPFNVTKITQKRDCVELNCEALNSDASQSIRSRLIVIADGANSNLRNKLGIAEQVKDYQQSAIVCNVAFSQPHRGVAYERFTQSGPLALLPLNQNNQSALVWTWPEDQVAEATSLSDEDFLERLQETFGHRLGKFERVGLRQIYPLSLRLATEQVRSRIVLMGNAAHFLHPVAGQGFNLALRDAARFLQVVREKPIESIGNLEVLQEYEQIQLKDQRRTVMLSDTFNALFRKQWLFAGSMRAKGFFALQLSDELRELFIAQLSGRAQGDLHLFAAQ